jgi:hypothetical protein
MTDQHEADGATAADAAAVAARGGDRRTLAQMQEQERLDLAEISELELAALTNRLVMAAQREDALADAASLARLRADAVSDTALIESLRADAVSDGAIITGLCADALDHRATIAALQHDVAELEAALLNARRIGGAIGALMATRHVTESEALQLLVHAGLRSGRKVRDVADDVLRTAEVPR